MAIAEEKSDFENKKRKIDLEESFIECKNQNDFSRNLCPLKQEASKKLESSPAYKFTHQIKV